MVRLQSLEHFVVCYIVIKDLIKSPAKKLGKSHARDKKLRHSPPPPFPLETRRELGPKCVAQSFLGSLLVTCRSAIGQFVSPFSRKLFGPVSFLLKGANDSSGLEFCKFFFSYFVRSFLLCTCSVVETKTMEGNRLQTNNIIY